MKVNAIFRKSVLALVFANITACTDLNLPTGTSEVLAVSKTGNFVLLDTKGKPILSCQERENTNDKCRVPTEKFTALCKNNLPEQNLTDQKQVVDTPTVKDLKLGYCIYDFRINPTCRTYVDRVTGKVYEICW